MGTERQRLLADALASGMIGYGAVVLFFAVLNALQGQSAFHTAAVLGGALFGAVPASAGIAPEAGVVLAFNGVHMVGYLLLGLLAAWLVYEAELHPAFWYLAFALFVAVSVVGYLVVVVVSQLAGLPVSPWLLVSASIVAAVAMVAYLAASHRALVRSIREQPDPGAGAAA